MSKKGQFVRGGQQSPEIKAKIKAAKARHLATAQTRSDKIMAAVKRLEDMKTWVKTERAKMRRAKQE